MSGYICTKPCMFGGRTYTTGEVIPPDAVLPTRSKTLIRQGYIALAGTEPHQTAPERPQSGEAAEAINIPITTGEGTVTLQAAPHSVVDALVTVQKASAEAIKDIEVLTDADALILIHRLDGRKSVREAAKARAAALEEESAGDA